VIKRLSHIYSGLHIINTVTKTRTNQYGSYFHNSMLILNNTMIKVCAAHILSQSHETFIFSSEVDCPDFISFLIASGLQKNTGMNQNSIQFKPIPIRNSFVNIFVNECFITKWYFQGNYHYTSFYLYLYLFKVYLMMLSEAQTISCEIKG
jgi:hypothetical protein